MPYRIPMYFWPFYPQFIRNGRFAVQELVHFLKEVGTDEASEQRRRVLKVFKRPIADPEISRILPEDINRSLGFAFYEEDRQANRIRLFVRSNGEIAKQEAFWDAIEDLAAAIARSVQNKINSRHQRPRPETAIYEAEPSDDQRHNYRRIRSELLAHGFRVVPEERIPDDYTEAAAFINSHLSLCNTSVHLIGERSGYMPSPRLGESSKPITQLQLDLAEARCSADPSFRRFIWARQRLQPGQADQQALLSALKDGTELRDTDEFVTEPLELFKDAVLDHLDTRSLARPWRGITDPPRPILMIAHQQDKHSGNEFALALHAARYEVFSLSFDDLRREEELRIERLAAQVDAAIVLFRAEDQTWAQRVLGTLYGISTSKDQRPAVRALLFHGEGTEARRNFRTHYCNLVLTSPLDSWDDAIEALRAELDQAPL